MSNLLVRRSGRKLGTARDARMAHALHNGAWAGRTFAKARYQKEYDRWLDQYYAGKAESDERPHKPAMVAHDWLPEGWERLGNGSYRTAYLSPKGVVYKVNRGGYDSEGSEGYNYAEVQNIIRIKSSDTRLPALWVVPDATLYRVSATDVVAAMPLVDTSEPLQRCYRWADEVCTCADNEGNKRVGGRCTRDLMREGERLLGVTDMHTKNVFPQKDGRLAIVDLGL